MNFVSPGDGIADLAVGAIGYPAGTSHGAVYILFLTPDNKIREYKYVADSRIFTALQSREAVRG